MDAACSLTCASVLCLSQVPAGFFSVLLLASVVITDEKLALILGSQKVMMNKRNVNFSEASDAIPFVYAYALMMMMLIPLLSPHMSRSSTVCLIIESS